MGDETDGETFDFVIEDMTSDEFVAVVGGIGTLQIQALSLGSRERAKETAELLDRIIMENQELAREALLFSDDAEYIHVEQMPEDALDALDIEIVDGHVRDARATEVGIE